MTKNQENRLSMYLTVCQVTNYYSAEWRDFIAFKKQFTEFERTIDKIHAIRVVQEGSIKGVTQDKRNSRNKLSKIGLEIAGKTFTYASVVGNKKLQERVSYTPSDFVRCRDTGIIEYIQIIWNAASQYVSELSDFGITQEDLDNLNQLNREYTAVVENPRQAVTNRTRATNKLKAYFNQTDIILKNRLDKLMFYFDTRCPDFWQQYKSARKIINLGHRKRKPAEELEAPAAN